MFIYRFFAESLNLSLVRFLFDTFCCSHFFVFNMVVAAPTFVLLNFY